MHRFKSILAVYDDAPGGDDVLVQATALARANGAKLSVVNLHEYPRSAEVVDEARRRLPRIVPWIAQEGVTDVETEVLVGTPHVEIARKVLHDDHDLVIVSAEGGRGIKGAFLGSTATNLLLKCPCAVWVLKPGQSVPCSSVLAALNPRLDDPCGDDLNVRILEVATSLARSQDAFLHVVHFWDVEGRDGVTLRSEITRETRERILREHEAKRRSAVKALLARQPTPQVAHQIHLPRGLPQPNLASLAARLAVDLIVMGSACRVGISRLLMGNLAETVLGGVRCSVLAVKPEGFRTPIALPPKEPIRARVPVAAH